MTNALTVRSRPRIASLSDYLTLKRKIQEVFLAGQRRIEEWRVRSYWETGYYINEHVRLNAARADYGQQVLIRLGKDLEMHKSVLGRCSQFAEKFPDLGIDASRRQSSSNVRQTLKNTSPFPLSWSHYRALITVADDTLRFKLAAQAEKEGWIQEKLEQEIWKLRAKALPGKEGDAKQTERLLTPKLGKLFTYRLIAPSKINWRGEDKTALLWDRGFKGYKEFPASGLRGLSAEQIVEIRDGRFVKSERTAADLFTYLGYLDRAVDGDTLWVTLDQGLGEISRQKLRLRGIDAPEINTAAGKRALEFLKSTLAPAPYLIVRSYKNDKYDRFETDLFIPKPSPLPAEGEGRVRGAQIPMNDLSQLLFINNHLLVSGHAVLMKE